MKQLLLILLSLHVGLSSLNAQDLFTSLSYDEVVAQAKLLNKPYYIDFSASWCLPCKLMDETVFQDVLVNQYTKENYIALKLDVNDFDALILKGKYKVVSLPTILFFSSSGKLIAKVEGLQTGTHFLELLKKYQL